MLTVFGLIETNAPMTEAALETYGFQRGHAVAQLNLVVDASQKAIDYTRGTTTVDVFTQVDFPDLSSSLTAAGEGRFDITQGLPQPMIQAVETLLCLQNTVIAPDPASGLIKRMSLLRQRPDISAEEFQTQWFDLHAVLVKRLRGVRGYRQNLVIDGPRDVSGAYLADGIVELWFDSSEAIENAFSAGPGLTLMMHAREFIDSISTFLVDPFHRQ